MVLAYTTASKNASSITAPNALFNPPTSVPDVVANWYTFLTQPGVTIGGSHPFLDPSGYRADKIFQLVEDHYGVPNLYDTLLQHYSVNKSTDALGKTYEYQFTYEHSALAAYKADATKTYRYARLPDYIGLSGPSLNSLYEDVGVVMPGLRVRHSAEIVRVPGKSVAWGLTVLNTAPNPDNAVTFLELLFSNQGVALQTATGPTPISPPIATHPDYAHLPGPLRSLVSAQGPGH
jgi:ABC-type molybdate transport system substrate-binding protein